MQVKTLQKVAILGSGSFGTAMAQVATFNPQVEAVIWGRDAETINDINTKKINPKIFSEYKLNQNISATTDLDEALKDAVLVVGCLPAQVLPKILEENKDKIPLDVPFVNCAKGMIVSKEKFLSEVVEELFEGKMKYCVLSGPSFAKEMMDKNPTVVVIASKSKTARETAQRLLSSVYFRSYTQSDVIGVEIAGALKNVLAIGAGMIEGIGYGINSISAFISRGSKEVQTFALIYKANPHTFFGLAGIGDLMLTSFGKLSRNRSFGSRIGKGEKVDDILKSSGVVEGLPTLNVVMEYATKHKIDLPIISTIYDMVHGKIVHEDALVRLMLRELEPEFFDFGVDEASPCKIDE